MSSYKIGIICKKDPESKSYVKSLPEYWAKRHSEQVEYENLDFRANVELDSMKKLAERGICSYSVYTDYSDILRECDEVHLIDMRISHSRLNVITHNSQFK